MPPRYDREGLATWATERFHTIIEVDEIRPMLRAEMEAFLIKLAHDRYQGAALCEELDRRLDAAYPPVLVREKHAATADAAAPGRPGLVGTSKLWVSRRPPTNWASCRPPPLVS